MRPFVKLIAGGYQAFQSIYFLKTAAADKNKYFSVLHDSKLLWDPGLAVNRLKNNTT